MKPTASIRKLAPFFQRKNVRTIVDYGAGNLRNSLYLQEKGFNTFAVDTPTQISKIHTMPQHRLLSGLIDTQEIRNKSLAADLVISNFVLNIINDPGEKEIAIANTYKNLAPGGYFLVEIREKKTAKGKGLTQVDLDSLILPAGFEKILSSSRERSLVVLYQKSIHKSLYSQVS